MLDALAPPPAVQARDGQSHAFIPEPSWSLADTAEAILRETFTARGHFPAEAHWDALRDILATIQAMADGTADQSIHLAGISPGIGKTSSIVAAAAALRSLEHYSDVGMVVCVGRLEEARQIALSLHGAGVGSDTAVLIGAGAVRELGDKLRGDGAFDVAVVAGGEHDPAGGLLARSRAILITSQQRVCKVTERRRFREVADFTFNGADRPIVIWDESLTIAHDLVVPRIALSELEVAAHELDPRFGRALEQFKAALIPAEHAALVDVPDWTAEFGVEEGQMREALLDRGMKEDATALDIAAALFLIGGRAVRVYHDRQSEEHGGGNTVISFKDALPNDLLPILVLDASVLVRPFYDNLVAYRGAKRLRPAQQNYRQLRTHLWQRGGGKRSFIRHGAVLIEGIVKTILNAPQDRWLIVHHRARKIGFKKPQGFEEAIRKELPASLQSRVSFITWANHCGVNAFKDYERVILAGTLFLTEPAYTAMTHSSRNEPLETHSFAEADEVKKIRDGQNRDAILQAGLRGNARHSDGDTCGRMELYIIASPN